MNIVGTIISLSVLALASATAFGIYSAEQKRLNLQGDVLELTIEAQSAFLERCGTIAAPITLAEGDWQTAIVIDHGTPANWTIVLEQSGASIAFTSSANKDVEYVASKTRASTTGNTASIQINTPDFSDVAGLAEFKYFAQGIGSHCN